MGCLVVLGYSSCGGNQCELWCCGAMSISCVSGQDVNPLFIRGYDYIIKTLDYFYDTSSANHRGISMIMGVAGGICNVRYDHCIGIHGQLWDTCQCVFYNSVVLRNQLLRQPYVICVRVNWRSIWIDMAVTVKCSHGDSHVEYMVNYGTTCQLLC